MEAGAIGFGTSRTLNHRSSDGSPIATLTAGEDELTGIALGIAAAGKGVLQVVSDFADEEAEFAMLRRVVERSGRPMSFSLIQSPVRPDQLPDPAGQGGGRGRRRPAHQGPGRRAAGRRAVRARADAQSVLALPGLQGDRQAPAGRARRAAEATRQFRERLLAHPPEGRVRGADEATGPTCTSSPALPDYEPHAGDLDRRDRRAHAAPRRKWSASTTWSPTTATR